MNLKYYLRGLGVGIVVTALIMGISLGGKKESLSDKEIKARASELGMVEAGTTLKENLPEKEEQQEKDEPASDVQETAKPVPQDENQSPEPDQSPEMNQPQSAEDTQEAKEQETMGLEENLREADASEEEASDQNTLSENVAATETEPVSTANKESITIEVRKGDGSYTVCKRLEEAGLIASATSFDTFLCENGYDKRIRSGSFEIPADADPEQIARILNGVE